MPTTVFSFPVLATAILVLATGRSWRARRAWVEAVGLVCLLLLAALALARFPASAYNATLPLAAILSAWLAFAYAEWRFAPDLGQHGFAWTFYAAAGSTLPVVLGAVLALAPCAYLNRTTPEPVASAALIGAPMLLAHAFHRALAPRGHRARSTPSPEDDGDGDGGSALRPPDLLLT
jgi:hypothetical protein